MSEKYYMWEPAEGISLQFKSARNGGLMCLTCDEIWCTHVQKAMVQNLDAEFVWDFDLDLGANQVQVPMFPTSSLWAQVVIEPIQDRDFARLTYLESDTPELGTPVSYLHSGEGRNVIRTVLIDYMLTQRVVEDKLICNSPSHKYRQEKLWQQRTDHRSKNRVAEYWSVWAAGGCTACRNLNQAGFDPDLVPDKEGSIW